MKCENMKSFAPSSFCGMAIFRELRSARNIITAFYHADQAVARPQSWRGEKLLGFALTEVRDELA